MLLAVGLAAARSPVIPPALVILGGLYAFAEDGHAIAPPLFATGLLVVAELAWWSVDERLTLRADAAVAAQRLRALLPVVAAAAAAATLVYAAAEAGTSRSTALTALGGAALVAAIALLSRLGRTS